MRKGVGTVRPKPVRLLAVVPAPPARKPAGEDVPLDSSRNGALKRFGKNKDVIVAGKHCGSLFINHDGWLFRYKLLHNGNRQVLDFILPGQVFGLQACLFSRSLYSVTSVTEASVSVIPFDMIDQVFEQSPKLGKSLFWSAVCESAVLGEHLIDTARRSAYERVSHLLLELLIRLKSVNLTRRFSFEMPLTQELIGDALGLTAVHVNRTLRSLRDDKLIEIDGKWITLVDIDAMSSLCDFENSYLGDAQRLLRQEMALLKSALPIGA